VNPINTDKVELQPAYRWTCPHCHAQHFESSCRVEFTPDEALEMRLQHGVDPLEEGEFLTSPPSVTCSHCEREFDTYHFGDEPRDD
jgi:hypothetical protein